MEPINENKNSAKKMAMIIVWSIVIIGIILIAVIVVLPKVKDKKETTDKTEVTSSQENEKSNKNSKSKKPKNLTEDFEITSYSAFGRKVEYGVYVYVDDEEYHEMTINSKDYDLPSNLNQFKEDIRLRLTYSPENYEVYDCKVINYLTGEIIEDLSEENIDKLFNIEYDKKVVEKDFVESINLSELEENVVYKYTSKEVVKIPEVKNDTGKFCLVYSKSYDFSNYEKKVYATKSAVIEQEPDEYSTNESDYFSILYTIIDKDEALELIEDEKLLKIGDYDSGDEVEVIFEEYIYNDSKEEKTIVITTYNQETKEFTIGAGEIWGFDWMIDTAKIK